MLVLRFTREESVAKQKGMIRREGIVPMLRTTNAYGGLIHCV